MVCINTILVSIWINLKNKYNKCQWIKCICLINNNRYMLLVWWINKILDNNRIFNHNNNMGKWFPLKLRDSKPLISQKCQNKDFNHQLEVNFYHHSLNNNNIYHQNLVKKFKINYHLIEYIIIKNIIIII